ncbi:signaling threshold-regulating transmembrane adapter 1 isoform X6 [Alligator mississippiensis]|uniref:signaling threshold-regulating transmembrane adapter 1 isoform X6 n=1 Tax=Alligator mississippiensis TaxID=8496 RepID=UPI00287804A7|nr:signaling threshold-regulating transmembrane adapter 1 isoform X6 [Alligator mississippiensis]
MDFCLDGSVFATAGTDRHIRLYDSCTMQENHIFLTGGWDNSVKVWDKRIRKEAQRVINGPHICGPGLDIWGHCVLTASWVPRNALQLWDLRMSQLQKNLPFPGGHMQGQFLYAAQFCDPDTVLAGGSGTCGAGVIRISTHQVTQGWSSLPCRQQWSLGIPAECASGPHRVVGVQRGCERG